jgi:hypothetical protein
MRAARKVADERRTLTGRGAGKIGQITAARDLVPYQVAEPVIDHLPGIGSAGQPHGASSRRIKRDGVAVEGRQPGILVGVYLCRCSGGIGIDLPRS